MPKHSTAHKTLCRSLWESTGIIILRGLFLITLFTEPLSADRPLNVVLLYADDWRHDTLGVAGNPVVKTPNLDRLAKTGIRFTHNCVTTSTCWVGRASLYTGQWMSRHGCLSYQTPLPEWKDTYPAIFRAGGYHTGHVGKWHNGDLQEGAYDFATNYYGRHWYELDDGRRVHVTQRNEEDALNFLRTRPKDKPFLLNVCFFATHAEDRHKDQYLPQPESMKLYQDVTVPIPPNANETSWRRMPSFFHESNEGRRRWGKRFETPEKFQRMMKNYYRLATEVDATCGKIIAELENQGVMNKTLVVFTTDNGYYHAEHGLADKWYPHQESIRVPLIIWDPRLPVEKRGAINDSFTLNVDLAPTFLSAANLPIPRSIQGSDMAPLYLAQDPPEWREEFFYEHPMLASNKFIPASQALVRKDWKYIYWPHVELEQLFDLKADPREESDLAQDPVHTKKLVEMRKRFNELKAAVK